MHYFVVALSFYRFLSILKWSSLRTDHNFYYQDCTFLRIILESTGLGLSIDPCDHCNFIKCIVGFVCKNAKIRIFRSVYLHSVSTGHAGVDCMTNPSNLDHVISC